ncbi:sensor histidine kinase [Couchioplanes azureus]|uniref:sensor histidine kinase n=1 Tax=Couchioplanes caeruleus TaxID=56438 RepID=UPI00166F9441|nr:histidine kinase [Couchioplanes caeruleus]GGQ71300.1 histidine kinase [Couchioplanes caeruleus subsp. azureus]
MRTRAVRLAAPLVGRRARLRWLHLVLGGALITPYFLAALVAVQLMGFGTGIAGQLLAYLLALPVVAITGLARVTRTLAATAARVLLGTEAGPGGDRWRTAAWHTLHLALGAPVSAATLAVPPAVVTLWLAPVVPVPAPYGWAGGWGPLAGTVLLAGLVAAVAAAGALLAAAAPRLLGPTPADRLAEVSRRADRLAERNRLARELHDSVGHTLSVVTVQAGAARRVLESDPAFAARALEAIDDAARVALADLDHVLGLLRDGTAPAAAPALTRGSLDRLVGQVRAAGATVSADVAGDLGRLPPVVAREAYRILQESLGNALRHAGPVAVTVRVEVAADRLAVETANPLPARRRGTRPTGGRGLAGLRERVALLGGAVTAAGADTGDRWRLAVELPLGGGR